MKKGNKLAIKNLLTSVTEPGDAEGIEAQFEFRDPVFLAAQHEYEEIAVMLIELGFSYTKEHKQARTA